jgi:amino acid exporter
MVADWKAHVGLLTTMAAPYALVLASPGPNLLVVLRAGLLPSIRRPLAAALGIALGATLAAGLGVICATVMMPIRNIEIAGTLVFAAMLLRSAQRLLTGGLNGPAEIEAAARRGAARLFALGFVAAATNPMSISFFVAFFVAHPALQGAAAWACALVFAMAAVWFGLIGVLFAHSVGRLVSNKIGRILRFGLAAAMIAVAAGAIWRIVSA